MLAKQAEGGRQAGAQGAVGRRTGRNQLRVEGVQEFNPAGNQPVQLSRKSEKQARDNK